MYRRARILFFAVLTATVIHADAQDRQLIVRKDFQAEWKVYNEGEYVPFSTYKGGVKTIYFPVEVYSFKGDYLSIKSNRNFSLFINGQILKSHQQHIRIPVDTLRKYFFGETLQIAVHQNRINEASLTTTIDTETKAVTIAGEGVISKPDSFFRDFVIVAVLILLIIAAIMVRLNPKLTVDFFSVNRIFSTRETLDGQTESRLTGSTNVLFYGYVSLIIGWYMMIIFYHAPLQYSVASYFQPASFPGAIVHWVKLSLTIFGFFFAKILIVYLWSRLFAFKEVAGMQFFNWIRLLLNVFGVLGTILFVYFVSRGASPVVHSTLYFLVICALLAWVIIIFFKLFRRTEYSMFHIFSYICATEIIPVLVTIKVLFN